MGEAKEPVLKINAPLEDGDVIIDAFENRFIIKKVESSIYDLTIEGKTGEIICPFCQTPQEKTSIYGKMRLICKSCEEIFEVERRF